MLTLFVILLSLLLVTVTAKWLLLKREIGHITETVRDIHGRQTNQRVTISSRDKNVAALANAINGLYGDIYEERGNHRHALDEMRQSMANISHDLRTPLTSIIGYVKLLQDGSNTPEKQAHYLSVVFGKADYLNRLIGDLFELARLETGIYPFEMERLNITALLQEELAGFYDVFDTGGAQPVIELPAGPLWATGDRQALSRVFSNLLQNMVKHGMHDIRITGKSDSGGITLAFSNRAEEMEQEDVERLFQRFFTTDRMRSRESAGLGLSIVKELVEQMGGTISAELTGEILTFTIVIIAN